MLDSLSQQYPAFTQIRSELTIKPLEEIQIILAKEDLTMVSYLVGDSSITALVIDPKGVQTQDLGPTGELGKLVASFRSSLKDRNTSLFSALNQKLYRLLWEPIQASVVSTDEPRKIIIIPDGPLHLLPFETLRDSRGGQYLVEQFAISYAPSINTFAYKYQSPQGKRGFAGFAPIDFDSTVFMAGTRSMSEATGGDLPWTEREIEEISSQLQAKGWFTQTYVLDQANEENLKQISFDSISHLHLATHALANADEPALSHLVLAENEEGEQDHILYTGEIYALPANLDLVVLSACQTGLGTVARGEGIIGLTRAFLSAGTNTVLVSLWSVPDRATSQLMIAFYANLSKGMSKTEALREAKISLLHQNPTQFPWYWAAFVLIGDGIRP